MMPFAMIFKSKDDETPIWNDVEDKKVHHVTTGMSIGVLEEGMKSGKPSVALRIDLPDGSVVFAETSARLFCTAARAITGRYPDLFEGE
jgi:hypothetical protein